MWFDSALGGVVVGAGLTWLLTTYREDRVETRRIRRDTAVEALRIAQRLRTACFELLAVNVALSASGTGDEDLSAEWETRYRVWEKVSGALGEELQVAHALATPSVAEALLAIVEKEQEYMPLHARSDADVTGGDEFIAEFDTLLTDLALEIRTSAGVDVGTSQLHWLTWRTARLWRRRGPHGARR